MRVTRKAPSSYLHQPSEDNSRSKSVCYACHAVRVVLSSASSLCLAKFLLSLSSFLISSCGSKSPLESFSYVSSYFPVDKGAFPLIRFLMSKKPFLHSMNALKFAAQSSGRSFRSSGSVRHSLGVCLWMSTQGDLCRQMAKAFFWSLQLSVSIEKVDYLYFQTIPSTHHKIDDVLKKSYNCEVDRTRQLYIRTPL